MASTAFYYTCDEVHILYPKLEDNTLLLYLTKFTKATITMMSLFSGRFLLMSSRRVIEFVVGTVRLVVLRSTPAFCHLFCAIPLARVSLAKRLWPM